MKKKITIISVIIIILLTVGWFFMSRDSDSEPAPGTSQNVTLAASTDKEIYNSQEDITINIKLVNSGEVPVCLGKGAIGNIKFVSATRDGETLETRSAPSYFLTSFTEILKSRLVSVDPGESIEFNIRSKFDPGLRARALSTTKPKNTSGVATFYNIEKKGQYEIELVYEYVAGESDKCQNILRGQTNKVKAKFQVK